MNIGEIGIEAARAKIGPIADNAQFGREVTYLTRHGKHIAAVVPLNVLTHLTRLRATEHLISRGIPVNFQHDPTRTFPEPVIRIYVKGETLSWGDAGRVVMEAALPTNSTPSDIQAAQDLLGRAVEVLTEGGFELVEDHRTSDKLSGLTYDNIRYRLTPLGFVHL
ncbi:hypothetical protein [Streptosporangium sp. CA-115845]|uniref:hypothetical protein n=1 Tax=Streptosporangium sp. CA-115845 TaxID=3240071 RepID=UPI003D935391